MLRQRIYGMNAANGLSLLQPKKGIPERLVFSYSGNLGLKMPTGMPDMVDAYTYRVMANEYREI